MNSASKPEQPQRSDNSTKPLSRRLAGAISPEERKCFLGNPGGDNGSPAPAMIWIENSGRGVKPEQWMSLNPEILLTGWSTASLPMEWLESKACALRYVCHLTGSVRRLVPRTFIERGGLVTNWGDIPSIAVAEQALLLALAALRNFTAWSGAAPHSTDTAQRVEKLSTRSLVGRRVGIHGYGRIARALVLLLRPFGVTIHVFSAGLPPEMLHADGVVRSVSLSELFSISDVLFECEALTPATAGSVSASELDFLPDGAVFVNVGRGGLVDEAALLRVAETGRIRVALDVVASEQLAPNGPFSKVPGSVLSPHIGGPTFDQYPQCGRFALNNIARFLRGELPEATITLAEYDRAT